MVGLEGIEPPSTGRKPGVLAILLQAHVVVLEGIEPSYLACRASALPLSYRTKIRW